MPIYQVLISETVERMAYVEVPAGVELDSVAGEFNDLADDVAVETGRGERRVSVSVASEPVRVDARLDLSD